MKFSELGLSPELLQAVLDAGYVNPTPIQQQAIPVVAQGRDVLGCAQTGTGKTASFALPMIDKLAAGRSRARMPRSLILEPTRELATQVEAAFERYGKQHRLTTALLIGGESFGDQLKKLDRGVDVLIATPGRMLDLFERGKILLSDVRILVIDEADRMLDMGFIPDVVQRSLTRHGFDAAALHGDMSQPKRTETLERFKNSEIRLLVASDVAARGLDIQGLSHVFCFDVPYHAEDYVHRIGRTGRAGREGRSFMLAAPEDGKAVAAIQKLIGKEIPVASIADFSPVELDFEGGDRRRGRRGPASNGHRASDHSGERSRGRPTPGCEG